MKATINWLKEYVDLTGLSVEELANGLTMAGLEVEAVLPIGRELESLVIGRILEVRKHPRADRLTVCRVDTGQETVEMVCGAPNVRPGIAVPIALPGCRLPSGIEVQTATIRGIVSPGMICSEREMGLSDDHSGIMILPEETPVGLSVSKVLGLEDTLLEVNVTPNRGDCLSHIGIAREVSAIFNRPLTPPDTSAAPSGKMIHEEASVSILSPELCPRYVARLIRGVTIGPSPTWLSQRLLSVGIRSINNVVDVTNFVLMELGQPLHPFDFDTLAERRIVVRTALPQEKMTTLDGQERILTSEMLVIADGEKGVALAGIMGGLDTEIKDSTTNILIESAYFEPRCIRRTAKKLGLSSEASMRFERGVDIEGAIKAADRAVLLIQQLAGGEIVPGWIDAYPKPLSLQSINLSAQKTSKFLGIDVSAEEVIDICRRLGLTVAAQDKDTVRLTPPSYRPDLTRPVDLMEEIARLTGYDRIPATIPNISSTSRKEQGTFSLRRKIRETLTGLGFDEIITYSFISEKFNDLFTGLERYDPLAGVRIRNPISEDQSIMRVSILPGLLETMSRNWAQRNLDLRLFEVGIVFNPSPENDTLPEENNRLGILWTGRRNQKSHHFKGEKVDFYDMKGVLESLAESLKIKDFSIRKAEAPSYFIPGKYIQCYSAEQLLGEMGEISPPIRTQFELKEAVYIIDLDVDRLSRGIIEFPQFTPWPKFPENNRDMALILDENILWKEIQDEIESVKEPLIEEIELFDWYSGKPIPEGKKNLGVRIHYHSSEKTLSDEEVNPIQEKLLKRILEKFGATLREK